MDYEQFRAHVLASLQSCNCTIRSLESDRAADRAGILTLRRELSESSAHVADSSARVGVLEHNLAESSARVGVLEHDLAEH